MTPIVEGNKGRKPHFTPVLNKGKRSGVVTKSLGWPTQEMDAMFGFKKHIGISHPKSVEGHPMGIPTESILDWAARVSDKL